MNIKDNRKPRTTYKLRNLEYGTVFQFEQDYKDDLDLYYMIIRTEKTYIVKMQNGFCSAVTDYLFEQKVLILDTTLLINKIVE